MFIEERDPEVRRERGGGLPGSSSGIFKYH
jgi:hypothetical protein